MSDLTSDGDTIETAGPRERAEAAEPVIEVDLTEADQPLRPGTGQPSAPAARRAPSAGVAAAAWASPADLLQWAISHAAAPAPQGPPPGGAPTVPDPGRGDGPEPEAVAEPDAAAQPVAVAEPDAAAEAEAVTEELRPGDPVARSGLGWFDRRTDVTAVPKAGGQPPTLPAPELQVDPTPAPTQVPTPSPVPGPVPTPVARPLPTPGAVPPVVDLRAEDAADAQDTGAAADDDEVPGPAAPPTEVPEKPSGARPTSGSAWTAPPSPGAGVTPTPPRLAAPRQPLSVPAAAKRLQPKILPPVTLPDWGAGPQPAGPASRQDAVAPTAVAPARTMDELTLGAVPVAAPRTGRRPAAVGRDQVPRHGVASTTGGPAGRSETAARPSTGTRAGTHRTRRQSAARRRVVLLTGLVAAVAVAAILAVVAVAFADRVPRGTTIGGVDVGGRSRADAVQALGAALSGASQPLPVTVAGRPATLDPARAGLVVDPAASVDAVLGSRFDLRRLWRTVAGGGAAPTLPAATRSQVAAALRELARRVDVPAVEGGVRFGPGGPQPVTAVAGSALDVDGSADLVAARWLDRRAPVQLPVRQSQPRITQAEVDRALTTLARPAASGPLTLVVGSRSVAVPAQALRPALSIAPSASAPGTLDLSVDGAALRSAVLAADPAAQAAAVDARIVLRGGAPVVIPAVDGTRLDAAGLAAAAKSALLTPQRRAVIDPVRVPATLGTAAATALGVKEKISTFSTVLTANAERTGNLRIAARTVNGTLVLPGATFSLNAVLGERTPGKGYRQAPVINGSRLALDYGGGVSQLATTIYNNVFFAGLADLHHMPHSFYISRYPEGREATVSYPTVDLLWRNDSPYAVVVQADVTSTVNVSFWSTKTYQVVAEKGPRTNLRQPRTVYDDKPGCVAQGATPGFDVSVRRKLYQSGALVRTQTWTTSYRAEDHVICGPKPAPATPSPSD